MHPRLRLLLFVGLLFITAWIFWHRQSTSPQVSPVAKRSENPVSPPVRLPNRESLPGQPALQPFPIPIPVNPEERSIIAARLGLPDSDVRTDLTIVRNLLEEYRRAFQSYPVGEDNAQILNALSGNNPRRLVFIGRDHPSLSPQGSLLDRWGTPYFFHFQSSQDVEIRSAGPDLEFYTSDDSIQPAR